MKNRCGPRRSVQSDPAVQREETWRQERVRTRLAAHAAKGGSGSFSTAIRCRIDIPGANTRSLWTPGHGPAGKTLPVPGGRHAPLDTRHPPITGMADRIEVITKALSAYVKPGCHSSDIRVVASDFVADGVPYTWFVNAQDGKEYVLSSRVLSGPPVQGSEQILELADLGEAEAAKGPVRHDGRVRSTLRGVHTTWLAAGNCR